MGAVTKITINKHKLELSKTDKVFFPESGITKMDIIEYYQKIWKKIEPYIEDRPIVMQRFPDGIEGKSFFQKKIPDYFPKWIDREAISHKQVDTTEDYVLCNNEETLVYLVNQGCLTLHTWLSTKKELNTPDRMVFDFDPSDDDFEKVRSGALHLKDILDESDIPSFVMTTGSKGIHVIIPLKTEGEFDESRSVAERIARRLVKKNENIFTMETSKDKRGDRVFVDYLRNSYGQTSVMPFSVRAIENAPVAVPLDWDELKTSDLHPQKYTINNVLKRVSQKSDPWNGIRDKAVKYKNMNEKF